MSEQTDPLKEATVAYGLDLPVAPAWFSDPPLGTMDDGIQLSLAALEQVRNRPEILTNRRRLVCDVEFVL